jgi:hypothetical protein
MSVLEKYKNEKPVQLLGPSEYVLIQKVKISFSENRKSNSLLLNNYFKSHTSIKKCSAPSGGLSTCGINLEHTARRV